MLRHTATVECIYAATGMQPFASYFNINLACWWRCLLTLWCLYVKCMQFIEMQIRWRDFLEIQQKRIQRISMFGCLMMIYEKPSAKCCLNITFCKRRLKNWSITRHQFVSISAKLAKKTVAENTVTEFFVSKTQKFYTEELPIEWQQVVMNKKFFQVFINWPKRLKYIFLTLYVV